MKEPKEAWSSPVTAKMKKLDGKLKARWVKALRSGRYKQGKGHLIIAAQFSAPEAHCCLGVLKKVCRLKNLRGNAFLMNDSEFVLLSEQEQLKLSARNDQGKSFKEIADYIEKSDKI